MNFDRLAPHYDLLETVLAGRQLDAARSAWMDELAGCRRVLSVGEGHGRFAAAFARRWPEAGIVCVEQSGQMLAQAQRRCATFSRAGATHAPVHWIHSDFLEWKPPKERFDALVTCFFLDCFSRETLARVITKLAQCGRENAVWLNVDFDMPSRGFRRQRARVVHALMYAFFRRAVGLPAKRLTAPDTLLSSQGFRRERRAEFNWGLLAAEVWRRNDTRNDPPSLET
jgi:ubiquinone/menaquinone biosynthesis C-methylase UbiE